MNANEITNSGIVTQLAVVHTMLPKIKELIDQQQEQIDKLTAIVALRELKIERMIEDRSKYEAMAHAGGVEVGKELKTLTDEEIVKLMIPRMEQILEILFNEGWLDDYR
jgi:hypothetical protein